MYGKPQSQHQWLEQLLGDWVAESTCKLPDQTEQFSTGELACRSMGGLWVLMEATGSAPGEPDWSSLMTIGFNPEKNRYEGTFIASMMTHLWVYRGQYNETEKRLDLSVTGPSLLGPGQVEYEDRIEVVDPDHWRLSSHFLDDQGQWNRFMTADYRRKSTA